MVQAKLAARANAPQDMRACRFSRWNRAPLAVRASSTTLAPHAADFLTPRLQEAVAESLLQTRIGSGERGRGLFHVPISPPPTADAAGPASSNAPSAPLRLTMPPPPPPLLRVPLSWGLTLVCEGGGQEAAELQEELLAEWQAQNGVQLPAPLAALLQATDRPPALRLAAWFLWATRSPAAAAAATPLCEFAAQVLPRESASCLRLTPEDEARLPADTLPTLSSMRAQVASAVEELRALGAAEGFDDADMWWAFDMVISRSFAATATDPNTRAPTPLAAYVPWACLVNHSPSPNAIFAADLSYGRREFVVSPRLRYTPIEAGTEVCISYGGGLDSRTTLLKYGFVSAGNVNDRLVVPTGLAAAAARLKQQGLCSAAEELGDRRAAAVGGSGLDGNGASSADASMTAAVERERNRVYSALATVLEAAADHEAEAAQEAGLEAGAAPAKKGFVGSPAQALITWARGEVDRYAAAPASTTTPAEGTAAAAAATQNLYRPPAAALAPAGAELSTALDCMRSERRLLAAAVAELLEEYRRVA